MHKKFDALNFLCIYIPPSIAGEVPALLRTVMRNVRTHIAGNAARVRPLIRLADWSCMSVMTRGRDSRFKAELIRKARV
jgi:hypothetical protein